MDAELQAAIVEEIHEVETLPELKALWCFGQAENNGYGDARFVAHFKQVWHHLPTNPPVYQGVGEEPMDVEEKILQVQQQLDVAKQPVGGGRKYRLLSKDVSWSTKAQVHGVMAILSAHVAVGGVLDESTIVRAMVENERAVLMTRQGGKRIWDYYKGDHAEGLVAHGNVERM